MAKQVEIGSIVLQGFGTYIKETKFNMDRGGVNIVRGRNGSSKTTLFSALPWVLFQENLKGSKNDAVATWKSQRTKDFKGTRVVVTMKVDGVKYAIARHIRFKGNTYGVPGESDLLVFKENADGRLTKGCLVSSVRGKADTQKIVDDLIGVDARTFLNSIMFVQRSRRFVEADNAEKRKLLEELFDLGFVDQMKAKADAKVQVIKTKLGELGFETSRLTIKSDGLLLRKQDAERILAQWEERRKAELKELVDERTQVTADHDLIDKEITAYKATVKKLEGRVGDTSKVRAEGIRIDATYRKALDMAAAAQVHEQNMQREIVRSEKEMEDKKTAIENVKTVCSVCGSKLKGEQVTTVKETLTGELRKIKAELKRLRDALVAATRRKNELKLEMDAAEQEKADLNTTLMDDANAHTAATSSMRVAEGQSLRLRERYQKLSEAIDRNQGGTDRPPVDIEALTKEYDGMIAALEPLKGEEEKQIRILGRYEWWRSTGLSAKGLKAYVFSAMLEQLNGFMVRYAERMGLGIRFSVDLTKASTPFVTECYKEGEMVDYADLSGGEKQRIDIAMLMAMHDLVSGITKFNVLIMDEVFEGLDAQGMEQAFDLIRMKGRKSMSIYVITHSSRVDTLQCKHLEVVKTNGQSSINEAV